MKTMHIPQINQAKLDTIKATLDATQGKALQDAVEAMHELVEKIEGNSMPTTKDNYGSYLGVVTTRMNLLIAILAGAGPGAISAAKVNGI